MRFVLAIISFVLAAVMIGFGIAQRTILLEPDEITLSSTAEAPAAVTVIDGTALNAMDGSQTIDISGSDTVIAAYGRTNDVLGWVGDTQYTAVGFDAENAQLTSELVPGTATEVPDPTGSDLWLESYASEGPLEMRVNVPDDVSFLVVSDGTAPAPSEVQVTWPVDNSTPWSGPLIVAGAVALLLGLAFLLWATNHMRSSRGPRRKSLPKVPRKSVRSNRRAVRKPGRRAISRSIAAVPVVLIGSLLLSGCSPDFWAGGAAAPTPTPTLPAEAELDPPAVTVRQVERIIADISEVSARADENRGKQLIATRFTGAALELRTANYDIRRADNDFAPPAPIPATTVKVTLPQQTDTWPRTVFAIVQDESDLTIAPVALFLEQATPRENYKVSYAMALEASTVLPDVAPASVGTSRLAPDSPVLRLTPSELALGYADILERDIESDSYLDFEAEGDSLRVEVGPEYKQQVRDDLPDTAEASFAHALGAAEAIALATNDAGALVAVNLYETTTVKPVEDGAAVNPSGQVKALSGLSITTKGVVATYGDQLLFYVPPVGTDGKIVLLGYTQGLVKAEET